jgi:hypothetical protein
MPPSSIEAANQALTSALEAANISKDDDTADVLAPGEETGAVKTVFHNATQFNVKVRRPPILRCPARARRAGRRPGGSARGALERRPFDLHAGDPHCRFCTSLTLSSFSLDLPRATQHPLYSPWTLWYESPQTKNLPKAAPPVSTLPHVLGLVQAWDSAACQPVRQREAIPTGELQRLTVSLALARSPGRRCAQPRRRMDGQRPAGGRVQQRRGVLGVRPPPFFRQRSLGE